MEQYIKKSALVADIMKRYDEYTSSILKHYDAYKEAKAQELGKILTILNTLEVKDANEALRTEYEKGRADVIADTLSWLENCWPKYCSNQTIIEGFKEAMKE